MGIKKILGDVGNGVISFFSDDGVELGKRDKEEYIEVSEKKIQKFKPNVREYNISKQRLLRALGIDGTVTYIAYDYKKGILTIKEMEDR